MESPRKVKIPARHAESVYELAARVKDLTEVAPPLRLVYRGVEIRILEATKHRIGDKEFYIVSVQIGAPGRMSRPFPIVCENIDDFILKLKEEVLKFKIFSKFLPDFTWLEQGL